MSEMQVFNNPEFGDVRVIEINKEPWFVGKDVAGALGYSNTRDALEAHVDPEDRRVFQKSESATFEIPNRGLTLVNRSGVYALILSSKLPSAKKFKRWVTSEILPSVEKHGAYMTPEVIERTLTDPDYIIQLATTLKEEQQKRKALEQQAAADRPKVLFADAVSASHTSILVGELAKLLRQNGVDIGQNRLFSWLRDNGYLIRRSGTDYNMPTQRSMEMGLFSIKETAISRSDGSVTVSKTVKVTGRGQTYFVDKFLGSQKQEPNITKAVMDRRVQVCRE